MLTLLALLAQDPFDIRPEGDWGVSTADARKVLEAAGRELRKHVPERTFPPIEVAPKGGPITLFQRGPKGEIRVRLDVNGPFWAQYTFQFAHELGHVVCGYDPDPHKQKWFEESVCEAASLYVLRRSAETWKTAPPYPHWKDYAKSLTAYADDRLKVSNLPPDTTLAAWYKERKAQCEANAEDRPRNLIIAAQLLPLFEEDPRRWEALGWLNTETHTASTSFADYLKAWERHCPEKHKAFARQIRALFDVQ
ncbi:MAG TPA: hypothetical protein VF950_11540 [Planctomycetota bacterium]